MPTETQVNRIAMIKKLFSLKNAMLLDQKSTILTHGKKGIMRQKGHYWWQAGVKINKVALFSGESYF